MSEEVTTTEAPPAEILPAKSEDKLEIEKEEAEKDPAEEASKETDGDKKEEAAPESAEKDAAAAGGGEEAEAAATADEGGDDQEKKKRFKLPNVNLKAPKVPGFLRSKSKERQLQKDKAAAEGEEGAEKKEAEEGDEAGEEKKEEGEEEAKATAKDAKARVKEAMENIHMPNMPKMPKIHKPAFLKKKKEDETANEEEGEKKKEDGEEAAEDGNEENKEGDEEAGGGGEKKEEEGDNDKKEEEEKKKSSLLDNLKSMKSQVHMPAFLSKKNTNKEKDVEAGDKEESKELLDEKKAETGEEGGEKKEDEQADEKEEEKKEGETEEAKTGPSRGAAILESLRNVASHVPSLFSRSKTGDKDKEVDVEAGEKDELLEGKDDTNKKDDDLEEVKVVKDEEGKEVPDSKSHTSEKKDAEKPYHKYLNRAKEAKAVCEQRYNALDRQKQLGVLGTVAALLFLLFIIILVAICAPSDWTNEARISEDGKYVVTHTSCGPIQGLVDGPDEFSFKRIPYAVPVMNTDRWTHSKAMATLAECHEGTFVAHSHNGSSSCWRRYPNGADGDENCLTLDIYTSSVIYDDLMPVVVYIDGDDLSEEKDASLQPSASLARNNSMVFVTINYRRGVLGFLSLDSLSERSTPQTSGNYGLGDLISALKWIQLNIQHFGGHPSQVTLLARGSGATMATALTASPLAKGTFKQAWLTNGAGAFDNKTLAQANKDNKAILEALNCGSDEVDCLIDATADDLTEAAPYEWRDTNQLELPQVGEKGHSWIIIDKHILLEHPRDFWHQNQLSNKIPLVFGSTAQGEVTVDNKEFMDWSNTNKFEAHVESKLGSFNESIPSQAMSLYNMSSDHWLEYATMLSDIRTVCPIQELADYVSKNFVSDVYSYVATQKRSASLGGLACATSDIAAIFGTYEPANPDEAAFVANMQQMFATFVRTGKLPQDKDLTLGMYIVDTKITAQRNYPRCEFWKSAQNIVPNYANLD